jgi:YHS domain-containing protein
MRWGKHALLGAILVGLGLAFGLNADDKNSKELDDLLMQAQKICPVSGHQLGKHGDPLKSKIDGKTLFLCCDDCTDKPANKAHMAKVTAHLIAAQKKCPVTGKALAKNAPSVVVEGRTIFVCCKNCPAKVKADATATIAKVNAMLKENVKHDHEKHH